MDGGRRLACLCCPFCDGAVMLLALDTETSGLSKDGLDPLDPAQPHLVQLGAQLFDAQFRKRAHLTVLIKPEGWEIEPCAEEVHHIATRTCHRYGIRLPEALVPLRGLVAASSRIIAHHMNFDRRVITTAIHRAGGDGNWWARAGHKMLCTMEASTEPCALPGEFGLKFPSLEEAYRILVHGDYETKHDADSDIEAMVAVYKALVERKVVTEVEAFSIPSR